jgi:arginyl-tRNA synthetase
MKHFFTVVQLSACSDVYLFILQEEWDLVFSYILSYPSMLQSSVKDVENGKIAPHLVCSFMMAMCSCFSVYYRRVRILTVCIGNGILLT